MPNVNLTLDKNSVGLGNVDNTSDANKPVSAAQQLALDNKVDKVTGKGLSTEDYTTTEKTKLSGIASGATANSSDATLLARANHTGTQDASTITGSKTSSFISDFASAVSALGYLLSSTAASTYQTLASFAADVRSVVLTGFSAHATRTAILATDSILIAFNKIQKWYNDLGDAAFKNTGTTAGTLSAGDDARFSDRRDVSHYRKTGTTTVERWYTSALTQFTVGSSPSFAKDTIRAVPFIVSKEITLDRIGIEISGTSGDVGSLIRLMIYGTTNGLPDALSLDAGTVDGGGSGFQSITINKVLTPGLYWLALNHNSTTNIVFRVLPIACIPGVFGVSSTIGASSSTVTHYQSSSVYGTAPSNFPTPTASTTLPAIISVRLSA